jgi:hypothetical protein
VVAYRSCINDFKRDRRIHIADSQSQGDFYGRVDNLPQSVVLRDIVSDRTSRSSISHKVKMPSFRQLGN